MKCNEFENIGEAFHFYNNNTYYTSIRLNDILPSYHRGVVLSNGGNIGQQGADLSGNQTDAPTFNEWKQIPTDVTFKGQQRKGYTTYSQFKSNTTGNSFFYVRNNPDENPPASLEGKAGSSTGKRLKTLKVDNPAPYDPVCPIYEGDIELEESDDQREKMVRDIAGDSLSYGYAPTGSRLWAVHQAYRMIKNDSSLPGNDSLLIAFEDSLDKTKIGECREVDRKREAGQIGQASSINNSITCQTPWVETLRTFNEIYLASWESGNGLSQQQVTTLWELANKCPVTHGPGVYRSRNMLRYLADSTLRFEADCPKPGPSEEKSAGRGEDTGGTRARWAPNPSKGASTLHYKLQKEHAGAVLILWNSNGELVERSTLEDVEGAKSLDLSERKSGIYLYQIRKDGRSLESGKLLLKR